MKNSFPIVLRYACLILFVATCFFSTGQSEAIRTEPGLRKIEQLISESKYDEATLLVNTFRRQSKGDEFRAAATVYDGVINKFLDRTATAYSDFTQARNVFNVIGNYSDVIWTDAQLIELLRRTGRHKEALELGSAAEAVMSRHQKAVDKHSKMMLYNRIAAVLNESSRGLESLKYSEICVDLAKQLRDSNALATSYNEMGFTFKNLNRVQDAIRMYRQAQSIWEDLKYNREALNAEYNVLVMMQHNELYSGPEQVRAADLFLRKTHALGDYTFDYRVYELKYYSMKVHNDVEGALGAFETLHSVSMQETDARRNIELTKIQTLYKNQELQKQLQLVSSKRKAAVQEMAKQKRLAWYFSILGFLAITGFGISIFFVARLRRSNRTIQKRDAQKTMLISEIHHRVKNNLQYVRSLIEMQMTVVHDHEGEENLSDLSRRIQAMTLVHEMLYNTETNSGVDMKLYLERLFSYLRRAYQLPQDFELRLSVPSRQVSILEATSLGVIAAELFNNSVKYAFGQHSQPVFSVTVTAENDSVRVEISDNGPDPVKPKEIHDTERVNLGMRIIDIFSRQLEGVYQFDAHKGLRFTLAYRQGLFLQNLQNV